MPRRMQPLYAPYQKTKKRNNMKRTHLIFTLLLAAAQFTAAAKNGPNKHTAAHAAYHIHLHMPDVKDTLVFLAHYYGKGLYKTDSALLRNGTVDFISNDTGFVGGSYMILLGDHRTSFEFLINRGDNLMITARASQLPDGVRVANSPENDRFADYQQHARAYGTEQKVLEERLTRAATAADTAAIRTAAVASAKKYTAYRHALELDNPHTLLAGILKAMEKPEVPDGPHYLEDGSTTDSTFAYRYYKAHFWDGFDFHDDRLIYTPLYDGMLDEYMNKLVLPWPDSVQYECDMLLNKARGSKDVFHYTLWWLTHHVENSKVMGISDVFVYLVEHYYMKGDATWLSSEELQKYTDAARKMAPNVLGNVAPAIKLPNVITGNTEQMMTMEAPYTLIVFYSPNCGHCQHELPLLDSVYEAVLKNKGVKVYTVATEGEQKVITDFLQKHKLDQKWTNTWDPEHVRTYHNDYDVISTPTIYLLDDKKIIRGKKLDHTNIAAVIDITRRKAMDKDQKPAKH